VIVYFANISSIRLNALSAVTIPIELWRRERLVRFVMNVVLPYSGGPGEERDGCLSRTL
jgi:hypothetical protein